MTSSHYVTATSSDSSLNLWSTAVLLRLHEKAALTWLIAGCKGKPKNMWHTESGNSQYPLWAFTAKQ